MCKILKLLLARHNEIMPTSAEQSAISALVGKVKQSLDKIIVAPDTFTAVVHNYKLFSRIPYFASHRESKRCVKLAPTRKAR